MKCIREILKKLWAPFRSFLIKNNFNPSFWGVLTNPFWLSRRALAEGLGQNIHFLTNKTLDFGCGSQPYKNLLIYTSEYIGLELDTPQNRNNKIADLFYDGHKIPLEDSSIDSILSTQSFEHIPNPREILTEFHRVLKRGGYIVFSMPLMWPEHEVPYDFYRYTSYGIRHLLKENKFKIIKIQRTLPDIRMPAQLFLAWLYDTLNMINKHIIIQTVFSILFFAPISLCSTFLAKIFKENELSYLDLIVIAQKEDK